MARHDEPTGGTSKKKHPRRAFSFMSLGIRTKGWDKNHPPRDCLYGLFGKRMQRSIMGFGSLATAFYTRKLISLVILNTSHGQMEPNRADLSYFHERLEHHRESVTEEFKTMARAIEAVLKQFPGIKCDISQANKDPKPLISKIRKIMKGAHAARTADANRIRNEIFVLSHDDAEKRGWSMPATIEKSRCGIKSDSTARFLLPFSEREEYLKDPEVYREKVERNEIKLSLSGTWPAILYDESIINNDGSDGSELVGLFRSETLLRCAVSILCSPSAGRQWRYPEPGARSFASSQKESNAEINGIKKITPETIAYISTLAVFAVHNGGCFTRDLGGIDLSELYHDAVAVLRLKTNWTTETIEFWNSIIFGDRMAEEEEPKANRIDRFKELEAKQREKEGLSMVPSRGLHTQPAATPPRRRAAQNSNNSRKYSHVRRRSPTNSVVFKAPKSPLLDDTEDEDSPHSQTNNGKKRGPNLFEPSDPEDEPVTPPRKKPRRTSIASPRIGQAERQQRAETPQIELSDVDQIIPATLEDWEEIRKGLKLMIPVALAAGLKEVAMELTTLIHKSPKAAIAYYNDNGHRLDFLAEYLQKFDGSTTPTQVPAPHSRHPTPSGPTPEQPASKGPGSSASSKPPVAEQKAKKPRAQRPFTEAAPPPKITRSVTARNRKILGDENEPLTDPEAEGS